MIFKCENCGGNVVYAPLKGKMHCPYCDSEDSGERIGDRSLTVCPSCGGAIAPAAYASACQCEYCGNWLLFEERLEGAYEPHLLLPFCVDKKIAEKRLQDEFSKRLFAPSDFLSEKSLEKLRGIYVPFWLYDYGADYAYEGEGTRVKTWRTGSTEHTETSYYAVRRRMEAAFEQIPVDASLAMEDGVMDLLEPYNYNCLTGFEPKYMSGFQGEVYNQSAGELAERARKKAGEAAEEMMKGSLSGYASLRPTHQDLQLKGQGERYALLPVWQYTYRYRGKDFLYHVNGQTGKVIGTTPVSHPKVLAYGASVFVLVALICRIALRIVEIL